MSQLAGYNPEATMLPRGGGPDAIAVQGGAYIDESINVPTIIGRIGGKASKARKARRGVQFASGSAASPVVSGQTDVQPENELLEVQPAANALQPLLSNENRTIARQNNNTSTAGNNKSGAYIPPVIPNQQPATNAPPAAQPPLVPDQSINLNKLPAVPTDPIVHVEPKNLSKLPDAPTHPVVIDKPIGPSQPPAAPSQPSTKPEQPKNAANNKPKDIILFGTKIRLSDPSDLQNEESKKVIDILHIGDLSEEQQKNILKSIYDAGCETDSKLTKVGKCEPLRGLIEALSIQLLGAAAGATVDAADMDENTVTITLKIPLTMLAGLLNGKNTGKNGGDVNTESLNEDKKAAGEQATQEMVKRTKVREEELSSTHEKKPDDTGLKNARISATKEMKRQTDLIANKVDADTVMREVENPDSAHVQVVQTPPSGKAKQSPEVVKKETKRPTNETNSAGLENARQVATKKLNHQTDETLQRMKADTRIREVDNPGSVQPAEGVQTPISEKSDLKESVDTVISKRNKQIAVDRNQAIMMAALDEMGRSDNAKAKPQAPPSAGTTKGGSHTRRNTRKLHINKISS